MVDLKEYKEKEREQRSGFIVDAAEKLFFARGYDAVSMDDIAAEVGLSKAALYRYFENKEALYFAVGLRGTRILAAMQKEAMDNAPTNIGKVTAYRDISDRFATDYPDYLKCCYFMMSGRFDPASIMANRDVQEMGLILGEMYTRFRNAIAAGIGDGSIRSDVEPEEIAVLLTMISDGINNMRPDLLMILASRGIDKEKFSRDVKRLVTAMITSTVKPGESMSPPEPDNG
jgi:AcrR family transcriptional regulator